eukprot:1643602-Amphidinium_carterae.2
MVLCRMHFQLSYRCSACRRAKTALNELRVIIDFKHKRPYTQNQGTSSMSVGSVEAARCLSSNVHTRWQGFQSK